MNIHNTDVEKACKFLLQKQVSLEFKNKTYKEGRLILFYQKNFYVTFIMNTAKKNNERIEIPVPFETEIYQEDNLVYFDYRIKTLAKYAPDIETNLILYPRKTKVNRFWNNIMVINANE